ncbi:MAG: cytidine deaminase [Gammaproteobacteria bacterium]
MDKHIKHMLELAYTAMQNAYAPYSKLKVGACFRTKSDKYFAGTNVENASYGETLCAEASATANMITAGEKFITDVVIISTSPRPCPPCGACRQKIAEFSEENTQVHIFDQQKELIATYSVTELLPHSFDSTNLE